MNYYRVIKGISYDKSLLCFAQSKINGKGDGRISEEDAGEIWRLAIDGGRITESEERTFLYLLENLNWTNPARKLIEGALKEEQTKLKSFYKIIDGKRHDKRILIETENRTKGRGDGRISLEDAKELWPFIADAGEMKVEERRSVDFVLESYNWTENAKDWFEAKVGKIPKEAEESPNFLSMIQHILNTQFGVPRLELEYNMGDLQKQVYLPINNLSFDEALEMALESIFYYRERGDSFRNFLVNIFGQDRDSDTEHVELGRVRKILDSSILSLLPDESNKLEDDRLFDSPPEGEKVAENWIFILNTEISDHNFYVIVDRSGEKDTYNYGFN